IDRFPRWCRRVLGRADALVAPSPFNKRAVAGLGFQARIIPNVIEISAYEYHHRKQLSPRLFWMRTFHDIWNPAMAVRVLAGLREEFPGATLVMAGQDEGLESSVKRLAVQMGVGDATRFAGFVDMQRKVQEGNAADIFITTNRVDNTPVAVIEACAMGLPVVSTRVGGVPDLLTDGETGLMVPDNDDAAMANAIKRLLTDAELAGRLSQNGRKLAERCSWTNVRREWEQTFSDVMARESASWN